MHIFLAESRVISVVTFREKGRHTYLANNRAMLVVVFDWGLKGCYFEPHRCRSRCVVSWSKIHLLLSTGSTQEDKS